MLFCQPIPSLIHARLRYMPAMPKYALLTTFPHLTCLDLAGSPSIYNMYHVNWRQKNGHLRHVNFRHCKSFGRYAYTSSFASLKRLETLLLDGCNHVSTAMIKSFGPMETLRRVGLNQCWLLTDEDMKWMSPGDHLDHLDLGEVCPKSSQGEKQCRGWMDAHDLQQCSLLTDQTIIELLPSPPAWTRAFQGYPLRTLRLAFLPLLTDRGLFVLFRTCPHLQRLDVEGCVQLTDAAMEGLALGVCRNSIESLDVSGCRQVTDQGLEIVLQSCRSLKSLIADGCVGVTDHLLEFMTQPLVNHTVGCGTVADPPDQTPPPACDHPDIGAPCSLRTFRILDNDGISRGAAWKLVKSVQRCRTRDHGCTSAWEEGYVVVPFCFQSSLSWEEPWDQEELEDEADEDVTLDGNEEDGSSERGADPKDPEDVEQTPQSSSATQCQTLPCTIL